MNLKDVMKLSHTIKSIQDHAHLACDHDCYRPGDSKLMVHRLDQLAERLPLQHQLVNIPYENTHGGFELLSGGVTDLGPELLGWYGAPGINPNDQTSLFLVGNNFSVTQTRVIVGGRLVDATCAVNCPDAATATSCDCLSHSESGTATGKPGKKTKDAKDNCTCNKESPSTAGTGLADGAEGSSTIDRSGAQEPDPQIAQASFRNRLRCKQQEGTVSRTTAVHLPSNVPPVQIIVPGAAAASPPATVVTNPLPSILPPPLQKRASSNPSRFTVSSQSDDDPSGSDASANANPSGGGTPAPSPTPTPAPTPTPTVVPATCPNWNCYYQNIPIFQVELLSRQIMRIVIPKGVYSKDGLVDVHIATPYGVSQAISIPVLCTTPAPAPKCSDLTVVTLPICQSGKNWKRAGEPTGTFCFDVQDATRNDAVNVEFSFNVDGATPKVIV